MTARVVIVNVARALTGNAVSLIGFAVCSVALEYFWPAIFVLVPMFLYFWCELVLHSLWDELLPTPPESSLTSSMVDNELRNEYDDDSIKTNRESDVA